MYVVLNFILHNPEDIRVFLLKHICINNNADELQNTNE
jgi:hypothetical protein